MEVEIETSQGRLRGLKTRTGVEIYRGIPYATPPLGPLRFRAPQAPAPWSGRRDAIVGGASPVQSGSSMFSGTIPGNRVERVDEDCLTVDVWTPSAGDGARRPVIVWICGGAFLTGGSAVETYDGEALAAGQDVVVVSVNYRMGALGFLWVDGGDSNCGLRDQLAALRWARRHAHAFGGDPDNITVFGESAGAGSIIHFLPVAAREGLVRRAIIQSAGVEHTQTRTDAEMVKHAVLDAAGVRRDADLWSLPWPALLEAQERALPGLMASVGSLPFHPVVDGDVVPAKPGLSWEVPGVDVLWSWTAEEMRLYPDRRADDRSRLLRRIRGLIEKRTGSDPGDAAAGRLADFYADRGTGADIWAAVQTDALMLLPARRVALAHASVEGSSTHAASFDWGATGGDWRKGAFHAIDLPFSFGTLDRGGWLEFLGAAGGDDRGAHQLAERHMAAWGAYARAGDPGWGRFPDEVMHFDSQCSVGGDPLRDAAAAWEGLWSADGPPM
ncbi:MAG TPA: carboxylesterase family protein [Acidimicrobiales bacterium]|nr:carboxylesterase family protein [Acidimicrobiales bacterium]